jgi:predicted secreted protein
MFNFIWKFLLVLIVSCSIPNLDNQSTVYISTGGTTFMQISSNPSTGFWWSISEFSSEKLSVVDYQGEYQENNSAMDGEGSIQMFILKCSELCQEGDKFQIELKLQRSWEPEPINEKLVTVIVSNLPRIQ